MFYLFQNFQMSLDTVIAVLWENGLKKGERSINLAILSDKPYYFITFAVHIQLIYLLSAPQ